MQEFPWLKLGFALVLVSLFFFPGSVLRRGLEVFVLFHFVMVYRDRSWEIVQMEFITVSTNGEEESQ